MANIADLKDAQAQIIQRWAGQFIQRQRAALIKARAKASGSLADSIKQRISATSLRLETKIIFSFLEYGRYIDMKRLDQTRQRPVEAIEAWIRARGVAKFKARFKKASGGRVYSDESKLIRAMAWGIVKGKVKTKKHRRRAWYNKRKDYQYYLLVDRLRKLYSDFGVKSAKEAFLKSQTQ